MISDIVDIASVLDNYRTKTDSAKKKFYISKNEIKTIAVVLTTLTLLKNEKEFERDITGDSSDRFIDVNPKKVSKYFEKYKEREGEFYKISQKIIDYYNNIDKQIVNKAANQANLYIEALFSKLVKKQFTIKGIAFVFLFAYFCEEYGTVTGAKAKDELFGKFKKINWYDSIFDFLYEEIEDVDFWDEVKICQLIY